MRKLLYTITAAALTWIGITVATPTAADTAVTSSTIAAEAASSTRNWTITTVGTANTQRDLDRCEGPMLWQGRQHVVAHDYCNNAAASAWHDMAPGDTLTLVANGETISATYSHDFSLATGDNPPSTEATPGGHTIWVQVAWPNDAQPNTDHVIVFTKTDAVF